MSLLHRERLLRLSHWEYPPGVVSWVILGDCPCSLCSSMNEVVHTSPTIGSNVEEIVVNNTRFLMWDIGGQESLRSSWNTYYTNTEVRRPGKLLCRDLGLALVTLFIWELHIPPLLSPWSLSLQWVLQNLSDPSGVRGSFCPKVFV